MKRLLWHVHVRFDCGGTGGPVLGRSLFPVNFRVHVHFDCGGSRKTGARYLHLLAVLQSDVRQLTVIGSGTSTNRFGASVR